MTKVTETSDKSESKLARDLKPGDRIAAGFLPTNGGASVDVLYTTTYRTRQGQDFVMVAYRINEWAADADHFLAEALIPVEPVADPAGLGYGREPEATESALVGARVPAHTGGMVGPVGGGGELVTDEDRKPGPDCSLCEQDVPGTLQDLVKHQVDMHGLDA